MQWIIMANVVEERGSPSTADYGLLYVPAGHSTTRGIEVGAPGG
jgi:hypothetical protein